MTCRHRFTVVAATLLCIALTCVQGCSSVYQQTIEEMTRSEQEELAARIAQTRETCLSARRALAQSMEQLQRARRARGDDATSRAVDKLEQSVSRFELEVWNLQRHIASVRDVGDPHASQNRQADPRLLEQYQRTLAYMEDALRHTQAMGDALRHHTALLQPDAASSSVASTEAGQDPAAAARTLVEQFDKAVAGCKTLLALLR